MSTVKTLAPVCPKHAGFCVAAQSSSVKNPGRWFWKCTKSSRDDQCDWHGWVPEGAIPVDMDFGATSGLKRPRDEEESELFKTGSLKRSNAVGDLSQLPEFQESIESMKRQIEALEDRCAVLEAAPIVQNFTTYSGVQNDEMVSES